MSSPDALAREVVANARAYGRVSGSREPAQQQDEKQQRKPAAEVAVHQLRSAQTKTHQYKRRKEKAKMGSDAWPVWNWSQDDHGDFRQLRDSISAPPGQHSNAGLIFWGQQDCTQEKIGKG